APAGLGVARGRGPTLRAARSGGPGPDRASPSSGRAWPDHRRRSPTAPRRPGPVEAVHHQHGPPTGGGQPRGSRTNNASLQLVGVVLAIDDLAGFYGQYVPSLGRFSVSGYTRNTADA